MYDMDKTLQIINLCRRLDVISSAMYEDFSKRSRILETKTFWSSMAQEEKEHILFWEEMKKKYKNGMFPDMIYDKDRVLKTIREILRSSLLLKREASVVSENRFFLYAYRMEMHLMDDVFLKFFNFASTISSKIEHYIDYEEHLDSFFSGMKTLSKGSFETRLIVETVKNLWKRNNELIQQNLLDDLTGIYNRRAFFMIVSPYAYLAVRNSTPISVMMLDIDNFKKINDTFGHIEGDNALKKSSEILKSRIRKSDIICRYGGDEFIIFLYDISYDDSVLLAKEILRFYSGKISKKYKPTLSIGLSWGRISGDSAEGIQNMIRSADNALYKAKRDGKAGIHITKKRG